MSSPTRLASWIERISGTVDNGREPAEKLALRHVAGGRMAGEVMRYSVPQGGSVDKIAELATQIIRDAEADSSSVSDCGAQSYVIVALDGDGAQVARHAIKTSLVQDDTGTETEAPDARGMLAQLMRHNEAREKMQQSMIGSVMHYLGTTIEKLSTQNEELLEQRAKMIEVTESILTQQHERDLLDKDHEMKQERISELMGNVRLLLPAIAARLSPGAKVDGVEPIRDAVGSFVRSLKPEQMQAIQTILTPSQIGALMTLIQGNDSDAGAA